VGKCKQKLINPNNYQLQNQKQCLKKNRIRTNTYHNLNLKKLSQIKKLSIQAVAIISRKRIEIATRQMTVPEVAKIGNINLKRYIVTMNIHKGTLMINLTTSITRANKTIIQKTGNHTLFTFQTNTIELSQF